MCSQTSSRQALLCSLQQHSKMCTCQTELWWARCSAICWHLCACGLYCMRDMKRTPRQESGVLPCTCGVLGRSWQCVGMSGQCGCVHLLVRGMLLLQACRWIAVLPINQGCVVYLYGRAAGM